MKPHAIGVALLLCAGPVANAQKIKDPPWSPERINRLPAEVRSAVLAKCPSAPDAGHYFATYSEGEVHLHFEYLYCDRGNFCNGSGCLHETYRLTGGHYRLAKASYAAGND